MLLGELAPAGDLVSALLMANALLLGAACAAGFRLPVLAPVGLVGAAALLIGIDSGAGPFGPADPLVLLAGAATAALLIVFYLAAITLGVARPWQQIGVRIVGSWAAAIALLVLVLEVAAGRAAGAG